MISSVLSRESWSDTFSMDNHIVLNTMFRQDDLLMRRILGNIRKGNVTGEDVDMLKQHVKRSYDKEAHGGVVPTQLLPTKAKVDRINNDMFYELEGDVVSYSFERRQIALVIWMEAIKLYLLRCLPNVAKH